MVGLILSDAWVIFDSTRSKNALLGFKQSLSHFSYLWFLFNLLSHYCASYPILVTGIRKGIKTFGLQFKTRSMPCITELYYLFYLNKVKIIPDNIYDLLTPIALAHWIMEDGVSYKGKGLGLATDSYTIQDTVRLMNVLIIRYNLKCSLHTRKKDQYRIYISIKSMELLRRIVHSHMEREILYKLNISVM